MSLHAALGPVTQFMASSSRQLRSEKLRQSILCWLTACNYVGAQYGYTAPLSC